MNVSTWIIDAFTTKAFSGNPTAVCVIAQALDPERMLSIAREINFPVTAFIQKHSVSSDTYDIRYFTSVTEISACGHATLAAAKFVFSNEKCHDLQFHTINKTIIKTFLDGETIFMAYPHFELEEILLDDELPAALHLDHYKCLGYSSPLETLFLEVENPDMLKSVQPDYQRLVKSNHFIKEVVLTSISDDQRYDYFLRSFCPWIGIDEDPVTGSVHSVLGKFWQLRLKKHGLKAYQASSRGGELIINVFNDRVEIGGEAVIILKGEFIL